MHSPNDTDGPRLDRRKFLALTGGLAAGLIPTTARAARPAAPKRVLRVAHLTDVHVQPELKAGEGMAACLRHVQSQADKPELILFGGDAVMDSFASPRERTQLQWDLWKRVMKAENSLPVEACIGNHDVFGWDKAKSLTTGAEPDYGKKCAVEAHGMSNRYRSFTRAGWHFIILDSIQPGPRDATYAAYLDDEQYDWLATDLARVPATTPVLLLSHVPIVSAMPLLAKRQTPTGNLSVASGSLHTDSGKIGALFTKHPNVKVCLSGHLHQIDRIEIRGVTYLCNGAVCGNWWKGLHQGFAEGYALVDLYDDGSFANHYVEYGWKAAPTG